MVVVLMMGLVFQGQTVMAVDEMAVEAAAVEEAVVEEVAVQEAAVPEAVAEVTTVTGKLVAVDLENSTVTVEEVMGEETNTVVLTVNASTTIMKAGLPVALGDLAIEDMAAVEGMIDDMGNLVASSISVQ